MKKKILIVLGVVVLAFVLFMGYMMLTTKSHSPAAKANYNSNGLVMEVDYCRPYKKGRLIFGEKSENALQPYGDYWRTGANEATTFETNKDVLINGKELKAGKYQLYTVPGKDMWQVVFNSEWDRWGAREADHDKDVLRTEVAANNDAPMEEQLIIGFEQPDNTGNTQINIHWDKMMVQVPVAMK